MKKNMEKKEIIPARVKPSSTTTLKEKLHNSVHKVLINNKTDLTKKIEKVVKKSIKRIVKKVNKQKRRIK